MWKSRRFSQNRHETWNRKTAPSSPKPGREPRQEKREDGRTTSRNFSLKGEVFVTAGRGLSETHIRADVTHAHARVAFQWMPNAFLRNHPKPQAGIWYLLRSQAGVSFVFPPSPPSGHPRGYAPWGSFAGVYPNGMEFHFLIGFRLARHPSLPLIFNAITAGGAPLFRGRRRIPRPDRRGRTPGAPRLSETLASDGRKWPPSFLGACRRPGFFCVGDPHFRDRKAQVRHASRF